jgi:BlaI family penicillinase repressor
MNGTTRNLPKPTEFELDLLRALWRRGSATVRELHEDFNEQRPLGYTSILKTLQIMTEKGLVQRIESGRAHIYSATASQEETQGQFVQDLIGRLFGGSAAKLALHALSAQTASAAELQQIRELIAKHGGKL